MHVVFLLNKKCLLLCVINNNTTQQPNQHLCGCINQAQASTLPNSDVHCQPPKCIGNLIIQIYYNGKGKGDRKGHRNSDSFHKSFLQKVFAVVLIWSLD